MRQATATSGKMQQFTKNLSNGVLPQFAILYLSTFIISYQFLFGLGEMHLCTERWSVLPPTLTGERRISQTFFEIKT
jgi:hypothetical protein